ncbi:MMPL family protein [compost metagenome]
MTLTNLRNGSSLSDAYYLALRSTGKVVVMTGITLGIAVLTWVLSPIKFQADMGILLGFMFIMEHDRCTGSCSGVSAFPA